MRYTRSATYLILAISLLIGSASTTSFADATDRDAPLANLELHGKTVNDAIKALFAGTDIKYILMQTSGGSKTVDLMLKGVSVETALGVITRQAGLQYTLEDGVYVITQAAEKEPVPTQVTWVESTTPVQSTATAEPMPVEEQGSTPESPDQQWNDEGYDQPEPFSGYPAYDLFQPPYQVGMVTVLPGRQSWGYGGYGQPIMTFGGSGVYSPSRSQGPLMPYRPYIPQPMWNYAPVYGY